MGFFSKEQLGWYLRHRHILSDIEQNERLPTYTMQAASPIQHDHSLAVQPLLLFCESTSLRKVQTDWREWMMPARFIVAFSFVSDYSFSYWVSIKGADIKHLTSMLSLTKCLKLNLLIFKVLSLQDHPWVHPNPAKSISDDTCDLTCDKKDGWVLNKVHVILSFLGVTQIHLKWKSWRFELHCL